MQNSEKVVVVGSGSWGTAVANVFADSGHDVTIWGRDEAQIAQIQNQHENGKYLKAIPLSSKLKASTDLKKLLTESAIIVCSIPTQKIRSVFEPFANLLQGKHLVNTSKGIEMGTHFRVSEIFAQIAPKNKYTILSGPSFALEVVKRLPTAVTMASVMIEDAAQIQKMMATPYFRGYTSRDVAGVEFAGALKNVIAIASGMVTGLKLGFNAQAAIINRGIAEIMRMGKIKNADPLTYLGLAGTGDLILTCTGPLSRNRKVGFLLGEGKKLDEIQKELGGVAEGVYTANSAYELSLEYGIEMPIIEQVYKILYKGSTPKEALISLMSRELKEEW